MFEEFFKLFTLPRQWIGSLGRTSSSFRIDAGDIAGSGANSIFPGKFLELFVKDFRHYEGAEPLPGDVKAMWLQNET